MRKYFIPVIIVIALLALFTGCKPNSDINTGYEVAVKVELPGDVPAKELTLKVLDTRTLKETTYEMPNATAKISLEGGVYDFSVEGTNEHDARLIGQEKSITINESTDVVVVLKMAIEGKSKLIFGDIFFNGETNARMMHPDQYFIVANNGEHTEYLDGIIFAVAAHPNVRPEGDFTEFMKKNNEIPIGTMIQFPGSGMEYPLRAGDFVVVAATAMNHNSDERPNSVDLTGADFEMVFPDNEYVQGDPDNPEVPNMNIIFDEFFLGTGIMHPRGFFPPILFKVEGDLKEFMDKHTLKVKLKDGSETNYYSVPVELVIDGVETACEGMHKSNSLPVEIDKGAVYVTGCHRQELAKRKTEERNGRTYWIDTNDSSNDYERVKPQNAYPKNWRKN